MPENLSSTSHWKDEKGQSPGAFVNLSDPLFPSHLSGPQVSADISVDDDTGLINVKIGTSCDPPPAYLRQLEIPNESSSSPQRPLNRGLQVPRMNLVIFIVGSRGDVQPYVALALSLIKGHGHCVRIATHGEFRDLIVTAGQKVDGKLQFFDVGGDPKELMAFMVKNPKLMPGFKSLTNGDISRKRKMVATMLKGFLHSTFFPDPLTGEAFAADAIISNPPAFAHIHVAQALGIPLHMSFTMPWTATTAFSHPLVNTGGDEAGNQALSNYLSYELADMLMWQGLSDVVNDFRRKRLLLSPLYRRNAMELIENLRVPWTYCWSQGLCPKPSGWRANIEVTGFYFDEEEEIHYSPPEEVAKFLESGEPPIYIGFGSIVVKDAEALTDLIVKAVSATGRRALISSGWAGLGKDLASVPKNILFFQGGIPHDWLFANGKIAAVCHHGGAGTSAAGLRHGLPTIVVPFFGDQQFWGQAVHRIGAGPAPIPAAQITAEALSSAIEIALLHETRQAAGAVRDKIRNENGTDRGVDAFHRNLPIEKMRCDIKPDRAAVWFDTETHLKLSAVVVAVLLAEQKIDRKQLRPYRPVEISTDKHQRDAMSQSLASSTRLATMAAEGSAKLFIRPQEGLRTIFWELPKSSVQIIGDLQTGFANTPRLLGSDWRESGSITDVKSGFREAGIGLGYGVLDAVTGIVTEPIVGFKREGVVGVAKGVGRSWLNLISRPAAGALGLFTLPAVGLARQIRSAGSSAIDDVLINPRLDQGKRELSDLTDQELVDIVSAYDTLRSGTRSRRKAQSDRSYRPLLLGELSGFQKR
ncbi:hypothetical protein BD324DRAFT_651985 [Kockovaella imperatae]|uniref:Uncharacterized protein n=1 Tax=Kockovaella imperatae TaxID=4999 RepID=A0A1Y1UDG0_9TREE|nr:hypothetical protein BD324DRAFT_651985 [Kockovaella imperatae]ORX36080.1 hypothetical protein BD324DRAFT_651985 [Kockovaella imperatae]